MRNLIVLLVCFWVTNFAFGQYKLTLEKLPEDINSPLYDEIGPVLSQDGQTLYFTRVGHPNFDKTLIIDGENQAQKLPEEEYNNLLSKIFSQLAGSKIRNPIHSEYNQDVWIASFEKNELTNIEHPGAPLNNALPNSICGLTPNKNNFLIINQFLPDGGMDQGFSIIKKNGPNWGFPAPIKIENYYTLGKEVNVTMSPDGEVLILSIERKKGYGRNDLYVSFKDKVDGWTEPMNLGPKINSKLSEDTPTISADKKTIYFSSNRTNTMGGRDIFRSQRKSENWTDWTLPKRFIEPINSNKDDSQPFFNDRTGYLYFTSNRDGTNDVFRVKVASPTKEEILVKGKLIDASNGKLLPAKLLYGPTDINYFLRYSKSKDGHFSFKVPKGETYKVGAQKKGYLSQQKTIEIEKGKYYGVHEITLEMTPIKYDLEIDLAPIFFVQSESEILDQSYPALDYLLSILKDHPKMHIRIEGHTENRGKEEELLELSENRAKKVKQYLMDREIAGSRMETIGFGATKPAVFNKNERLREQNRRVEVRIVSN